MRVPRVYTQSDKELASAVILWHGSTDNAFVHRKTGDLNSRVPQSLTLS